MRHRAELERDWRRVSQSLERRPDPCLGERRRVDPLRESSQGGDCLVYAVDRCLEQGGDVAVALRLRRGGCEPEFVGDGEKALLCRVVKVAFEPTPLGIARLDDSGTRSAKVGELSEDLGLKPLAVDG